MPTPYPPPPPGTHPGQTPVCAHGNNTDFTLGAPHPTPVAPHTTSWPGLRAAHSLLSTLLQSLQGSHQLCSRAHSLPLLCATLGSTPCRLTPTWETDLPLGGTRRLSPETPRALRNPEPVPPCPAQDASPLPPAHLSPSHTVLPPRCPPVLPSPPQIPGSDTRWLRDLP